LFLYKNISKTYKNYIIAFISFKCVQKCLSSIVRMNFCYLMSTNISVCNLLLHFSLQNFNSQIYDNNQNKPCRMHENPSEKGVLLFFYITTINYKYSFIIKSRRTSYPHYRKLNLHKIKNSNYLDNYITLLYLLLLLITNHLINNNNNNNIKKNWILIIRIIMIIYFYIFI